jgi:hypothetical protein
VPAQASSQPSLRLKNDFAIAACLVAAVASLLRGRRYVHEEHGTAAAEATADQAGELVRP